MLPKILFTLFIAVVVYYGYRYLASRLGRLGGGAKGPSVSQDKPPVAVEETTRCPACGTFVVKSHPRHCGRSDCPYPR